MTQLEPIILRIPINKHLNRIQRIIQVPRCKQTTIKTKPNKIYNKTNIKMSASNDPKVAIGSKVSITTKFGEVYRGKIFSFDARSATLTLTEEIKNTNINVNKRVIKTAFITDITLIARSSGNEAGKLIIPKRQVVTERLKRAVQSAKQSDELLGVGVSKHAQALMDHLAKQYQCFWDKKTVVINSLRIKINPPYQTRDVQPAPNVNPQAVQQVTRIVSGVSQKFRNQ